jgi:death-on-curing protein
VTGIDAQTLARTSRLELLDSALHAPQAGFGDVEFHPAFVDKAAVLVVRIARNHPHRMATNGSRGWRSGCFCALNGYQVAFSVDKAVEAMPGIAASELDESAVSDWLSTRIALSNG